MYENYNSLLHKLNMVLVRGRTHRHMSEAMTLKDEAYF